MLHGAKSVTSQDEYFDHAEASAALRLFKKRLLEFFLKEGEIASVTLPGFSFPAGRIVDFLLNPDLRLPDGSFNLRETVNCPETYFNMRMRAAIQAISSLESERNRDVYIMEQMTPLYRYFRGIYTGLVGSEFLGDGTPLGHVNAGGLRNEDATRMTFESDSFDFAMSFDVLEHIPDYLSAFREVHRVLRPGGRFYFTAPFCITSHEHLVRAKLENGQIIHILPPEMHGDPVTGEGILCYHHFGWDVLDELKACDFKAVDVLLFDQVEYGFYTDEPLLIFRAVT
mgnify:CR=1 FL=1